VKPLRGGNEGLSEGQRGAEVSHRDCTERGREILREHKKESRGIQVIKQKFRRVASGRGNRKFVVCLPCRVGSNRETGRRGDEKVKCLQLTGVVSEDRCRKRKGKETADLKSTGVGGQVSGDQCYKKRKSPSRGKINF